MKHRHFFSGIAASVGMLLLILDSKTALSGAQEGIELCIQTVIPSLFPFFILSGILVSSLIGTSLPLLRPLGGVLGMPEGTESLLISGFLGGYPVGAKSVRDAWENGHMEKADAERLLSFCNNAGPAFLFGMAAPMFSNPFTGWVLWGIHILSALGAGAILHTAPKSAAALPSGNAMTVSQAMGNALAVSAEVCGWVILFRVICAFLNRWFLWLLPVWGQAAVTGLLELANGCVGLHGIPSEPVRFLLCSSMLAFGGLCVSMQTLSVTRDLNLKYYFSGKLIQTVLSIFLSLIYLDRLSVFWLIPLSLVMMVKKKAKGGSNLRPVGV